MTSSLTNAEKRAIWMEGFFWIVGKCDVEPKQALAEARRRYPGPNEPTSEARVNAIAEVKAYRDWQEKWAADGWTGLRECKDHADALIDALHNLIAQEAQQEMGTKV